MDLIKYVQDSFVEKKEFPEFRAGDTITVYYEIKEGNKTRTQFFRGVVIQLRGQGATRTFTIRKMYGGCGTYLPVQHAGHPEDRTQQER